MIDRYECSYCNIIGENSMNESENGEFVKYEDIKHLLKNTPLNSDYAECADEIMDKLYPEYNGIIRKGIEDLLRKRFA